jgi:hypothetical protein
MPPSAMPNQRSDKKKQITAWLVADLKDWLDEEAALLGITTTELLTSIVLSCKNSRKRTPPVPPSITRLPKP